MARCLAALAATLAALSLSLAIAATSPRNASLRLSDLPAGFKKDGATFDRFGLMNLMRPGHTMTIYFDDLKYDGKAEDFAKDPGWVTVGNDSSFEDREQGGAHDFGFSEKTTFAG